MNFDEDEIDKYVKKKEKEENSFRNKVVNFFGKYTTALNSASSQNDFSVISDYLKKNSANYKETKKI